MREIKSIRDEIFQEWRRRDLTNFCMADKHHYAIARRHLDTLITKAYKRGFEETKFSCPVWQCGGTMQPMERPFPKGRNEDDYPDGYAGDSQCPDLRCKNCKAVYRIIRFGRQLIDQ